MSLDIEDPAQLERYLRSTHRIGAAEKVQMRVLAGGVSNKTVWVKRQIGDEWVIKQALPKLRVKVDWFSDPIRIHREAAALRWLPKLAPGGTITPLVFEDQEHHLLAMEAVPKPHENWKTMLMAGRVQSEHVMQFARLLAAIHVNSEKQSDLLEAEFQDRSFFESLRLEPYYLYAAEKEPRARTFLHELVADTRARRSAIVHGDYSPKNILVRNDQLVLLDHEVIHWGDPAFDLGFALTHLLSKAHHFLPHRDVFLHAAVLFWKTYLEASGPAGEQRVIRHTLSCLLARVAGRSPLEYLTDEEKRRQREVVAGLMDESHESAELMIEKFVERLK